jgi:hypothetical protein
LKNQLPQLSGSLSKSQAPPSIADFVDYRDPLAKLKSSWHIDAPERDYSIKPATRSMTQPMAVNQPSVSKTVSTTQEIWINVGRLFTRLSPKLYLRRGRREVIPLVP